ncbi:hypothetical protein VKT23_014719 [Stygiomarasmius scandens]|uniref:DUF4470 domain-containing protein n=1 Tax=Marasmiellus scandens TaxID=2682957 RepID=A0ABR1IZI0_9AGAR
MPAFDVLNLNNNEGLRESVSRDFSLAFIASGDLRNVIRTVNELPEDYQGTINMLINDFNPVVVSRNFLILMILGLLSDIDEATELALHLWYSVFLPESWNTHVLTILEAVRFELDRSHRFSFGPNSNLNITFSNDTKGGIVAALMMDVSGTLTPETAKTALYQVMLAPERVDYRDRYYFQLKPSHRLAVQRWRETGLLHPFGASNAHLNQPNTWLFTPGGKHLLLKDSASPIQGWDIRAAFEAGKAHGTSTDDIMGCVYFYVKHQLRTFANRLRNFNINISLTDRDAVNLVTDIRNGRISGVPRTALFDRIEVSNVVDENYIGLKRVLDAWGPLVNRANKEAALIGLFMNWYTLPSGPGAGMSLEDKMSPLDRLKLMDTFKKKFPERFPHMKPSNKQMRHDPAILAAEKCIHICNESSREFLDYLQRKGGTKAAKDTGLTLRMVNKIVSPRFGTRLGSPLNALPESLREGGPSE